MAEHLRATPAGGDVMTYHDLGEDAHQKIRDGVFDAIKRERQRQIEEKGYDEAHDDTHTPATLLNFVRIYLYRLIGNEDAETDIWCYLFSEADSSKYCPPLPDKDSSSEELLIAAAALIVAELERRARLVAHGEGIPHA